MHETGIAVEIFHTALRIAEERVEGQAVRLRKVKVAIGELSSVDPELLKHAWDAVIESSPHQDAEMEVRWCPVFRQCPSCNEQKESADGSWLQICPDCHGPLAVEGGCELDLESIEFDKVRKTQLQ
jgi:hydrogenase nickel incorporation protein HypA/HybF